MDAPPGFLNDLKAAVPVYAATDKTAELAGTLSSRMAEKGQSIPFDELLIGATALERGYAIATRNYRHFRKIPGIKLVEL